MTPATRNEQYPAIHATEPTLFLAFELSEKAWKLGFTTGHGQRPRRTTTTLLRTGTHAEEREGGHETLSTCGMV